MYDVVIIGVGVVGSSIAYHLTREGRGGRVWVVEPDPTYEFASTPRAVGGGLMHAPAVGLATSELLLDGRFSTIDLSRLTYRRVIDGTPLPEQGII